LLFGGKH